MIRQHLREVSLQGVHLLVLIGGWAVEEAGVGQEQLHISQEAGDGLVFVCDHFVLEGTEIMVTPPIQDTQNSLQRTPLYETLTTLYCRDTCITMEMALTAGCSSCCYGT